MIIVKNQIYQNRNFDKKKFIEENKSELKKLQEQIGL